MSANGQLLEQIVKVAAELPSPTLDRFCEQLERLPTPFGQAELAALSAGLAHPEVRAGLGRLVCEWREHARDLTPRELAWALRAANATDEFHRARQRLELVWTGPTSGTSSFRRTDQALLQLIEDARASIITVTFAAYKVPHIAAALAKAAQRAVALTLILESTEESDGAVTFDPLKALGEQLARSASVYAWPLEKRAKDALGHHGALHVKCAVADDQVALISSANLTEHAMSLNMELGLLITGGDLPRSLGQHLRSLIQSGVLVPCKGM